MKRKSQSGSALIEFAASLILLSAMFTGFFQVSYTLFNYNALVNAVRAGARYASLQPYGAINTNPDFAKAVQNVVVYGDPKPPEGAQPVVAGLERGNVALNIDAATLTVSIRGLELSSMFSKVKLEGRPSVTFPFTNGGPR